MISGLLTERLKNNAYICIWKIKTIEMETTKTTTKKKETRKDVNVAKSAKKLSPIGEWMRKHPHGLKGFVVNDKRVLNGLSPFDPDYHLPQ